MVTNSALVVVRVPHPIQAGPVPASLWIIRRLLSLALTLGVLWAIPAAAADYPTNLTSWILGICVAAVVVLIVQSILGRIERNRVPGAMRWYGPNEIPRRSWIPTVVADLVEVAVVIAALPYLLSRSDDHGVLAGTLALLGGCLLALGAGNAAAVAWHRRPGWKADWVWSFLGPLPLSIVLTYAAFAAASDPNHVASTCYWVGLLVVAAGKLGGELFRPSGGDIRETVVDTLDDAADALTRHTIIAPTLRDRERSRVVIRVVVVTAAIAIVGVVCFFAIL